MLKASILIGTRPELIKLIPAVKVLRSESGPFQTTITATGQHRALVDRTFHKMDFRFDHWLDIPGNRITLETLLPILIAGIAGMLRQQEPELVIVQGDTASALAGALAASQMGIPVAHIEAGLRSGNRNAPFPEEINRRLISQIATLHFAPTSTARNNLIHEGIKSSAIMVTGNTGIDMLHWALDTYDIPLGPPARTGADTPPLIVVTCHRRESWQEPLDHICHALKDILTEFRTAQAVFVLPGNPALHGRIRAILGDHPRIRLRPALNYVAFIKLLAEAALIMTDSGGIQEEVPTLLTPTVVLRNETDRPEIAGIPFIKLVGTERERIVKAACDFLKLGRGWAREALVRNPFGDGHAARRIVEALRRWHAGATPPLDPLDEFFDPFEDEPV